MSRSAFSAALLGVNGVPLVVSSASYDTPIAALEAPSSAMGVVNEPRLVSLLDRGVPASRERGVGEVASVWLRGVKAAMEWRTERGL